MGSSDRSSRLLIAECVNTDEIQLHKILFACLFLHDGATSAQAANVITCRLSCSQCWVLNSRYTSDVRMYTKPIREYYENVTCNTSGQVALHPPLTYPAPGFVLTQFGTIGACVKRQALIN